MNDKQYIDNLENYLIDIDTEFAFKCRGCGKCCKNRYDVLLNARDVFNMAKKLNITPEQLIKTYCDCYIGGTSRIPVVRIKPKGVNNACPFMSDGRCAK